MIIPSLALDEMDCECKQCSDTSGCTREDKEVSLVQKQAFYLTLITTKQNERKDYCKRGKGKRLSKSFVTANSLLSIILQSTTTETNSLDSRNT